MGIKFLFDKDKEEKVKVIKIPIVLKKSMAKKEEAGEKGFVLEWERALGFKENPFKEGILEPVSKYLANFDKEKEKINLFIITNKKFGTITGVRGTGKTVLLKWLAEQLGRFKDRIAVSYIDGAEVKTNTKFVKSLFNPSSGFKPFSEKEEVDIDTENFVFRLKERLGDKKYVLLVDNLEKLTKERFFVLDNLMEMNVQLIVAGDKGLLDSLDSIKDWLKEKSIVFEDELNISLDGLSFHAAKEMIANRIERAGGKGIYPFDEELLKKVWRKSNQNPLKMMGLCNDYAIELSVKKAEGLNIEDVRSYQKDGIKLAKPEPEDDFFDKEGEEKTDRGKEYKIKVVNKSEGVVIEDEEEKKKKKYIIKRRKK